MPARGHLPHVTHSRWSTRAQCGLLKVGFPAGPDSKESACNAGDPSSSGKIPWRRKWQPNPVFLAGKFHGQRSLAGYSPKCCKELDRTKRLTLSLSLFSQDPKDSCNRMERILLELNSSPQSLRGFPGGASGKEPACQCRRRKRYRFHPRVGRMPWRREWEPTPIFLPGDPVDRGDWQARVHGVTKSRTRLKQLSTLAPTPPSTALFKKKKKKKNAFFVLPWGKKPFLALILKKNLSRHLHFTWLCNTYNQIADSQVQIQ